MCANRKPQEVYVNGLTPLSMTLGTVGDTLAAHFDDQQCPKGIATKDCSKTLKMSF